MLLDDQAAPQFVPGVIDNSQSLVDLRWTCRIRGHQASCPLETFEERAHRGNHYFGIKIHRMIPSRNLGDVPALLLELGAVFANRRCNADNYPAHLDFIFRSGERHSWTLDSS